MSSPRLAVVAACALVFPVFVGSSPVVADQPLSAPANVVKLSASPDAMKIAWDADEEAPRFEVQHTRAGLVAASGFTQSTTGFTTADSLLLTNLVKRTTYAVRVRALSDANEPVSPWSEVKHFRTGPMSVRIATFNIKDPDKSGDDCGPWSGRKSLVARDIVSSKADVIGIQEAYEKDNRDSLMDALEDAGGAAYAMTLPVGERGGWDNRLLYNTETVTLLNSAHVPYDHQDGSGREREYVWATFELKSNGHRFLVFTTHIEPGGSTKLKIGQWNELREAAEKRSLVNGKQLPVFVTGDFNTSKWRAVAKVMLERMRDSNISDVLGQHHRSYKTGDVRAKERKDAWINSYNGCDREYNSVDKDHIGNNIDWIFASDHLSIPYWRTLTHRDGDRLEKPIPSDHFLLYADAVLP